MSASSGAPSLAEGGGDGRGFAATSVLFGSSVLAADTAGTYWSDPTNLTISTLSLSLFAGTLLDTEDLVSQSLQKSVGRFGKLFTWKIKQKILGLRQENWAPIVIEGEEITRWGRTVAAGA